MSLVGAVGVFTVPKGNLKETANFAGTAFNELWNQCSSVTR